MTKVSHDVIAVLIDDIHVYFYTVTNDKFVLQTRRFKLDKRGRGICYGRGAFVVVLECFYVDGISIHEVDIYTKSGDKMQGIASFKYAIGTTVNINTKEDRIYLSSYNGTSPFQCVSSQG